MNSIFLGTDPRTSRGSVTGFSSKRTKNFRLGNSGILFSSLACLSWCYISFLCSLVEPGRIQNGISTDNSYSEQQQQQQQHRSLGHSSSSSSIFSSSSKSQHPGTSLWKQHGDITTHHIFGAPKHSRRLRVLMGILSADFPNDETYRKRHRMLFGLWNDPRVCSLPAFKAKPPEERYRCELIYTFVLGANPKSTPELVDGSRPFEVPRPITGMSSDLNEPDTVLLNIRENMNEGKSQTWLKYASEIAREFDLDYVAKCDSDSILHLHEFFQFAYKQLPPAPYNTRIYAGSLRDKAYWPPKHREEEKIKYESYFGSTYEGFHVYVAGQFYIMSTDLAEFTALEAYRGKCSYCEGYEDHDISAMAFHSPEPIKLVVVGRPHRYWEHPVKGEPRWRRIWSRESARVHGEPFEGKLLFNNSTFDNLFPNM